MKTKQLKDTQNEEIFWGNELLYRKSFPFKKFDSGVVEKLEIKILKWRPNFGNPTKENKLKSGWEEPYVFGKQKALNIDMIMLYYSS